MSDMVKKIQKFQRRNQSGVIGTMLLLMGLFLCFLFGSIAADVAHYSDACGELQNIADSAALAGAGDLSFRSTGTQVDLARAAVLATVARSSGAGYKGESITSGNGYQSNIMNASGVPGGNVPTGPQPAPPGSIPQADINIKVKNFGGGVKNATEVTITVNLPTVYFFAPLLASLTGPAGKQKDSGGSVRVVAEAARLPIAGAGAPPWLVDLNPAQQPGNGTSSWFQGAPSVLPATVNLVFTSPSAPITAPPPVTPYIAVNMAVDSNSALAATTVGFTSAMQWITGAGGAQEVETLNDTLTICDSPTYTTGFSAWQSFWTSSNQVVALPVINSAVSGTKLIQFDIVSLTGPMVPNSYLPSTGVFGEWQAIIVGGGYAPLVRAKPHNGDYASYYGASIATLVK
jgi:hypothetical protein